MTLDQGRIVRLRNLVEVADVEVFIIPGLGDISLGQNHLHFLGLLQGYTEASVQAHLYKYTLDLGESFLWQHLLDQGKALLDQLNDFLLGQGEKIRPLVLIGHSLGGFIIKHALCVANQQHGRYLRVLQATSGLILLGTPHKALKPKGLSQKCLQILELSGLRITRQSQAALLEQPSENFLENAARQFDDERLRADIISVYETKETKLRRNNLLSKSKKLILVDKDLATTEALHETLIGLPLNHGELWDIGRTGNGSQHELLLLIAQIVTNAKTNLEIRLRTKSPSPTRSLSGISITEIKAVLGTQEKTSTVDVEEGSSSAEDYNLIPLLKGFDVSRPNAKLPAFMMASYERNPSFSGRNSVLSELDETLIAKDDRTASYEKASLKHLCLCGMPGLGRTEIAVEYAYSRRERFDAVFWVRADEEEKLKSDFSQIALELGLEDKAEPNNQLININIAKGWLASPKRLLDENNADRPDVLDLVKPLFGSGSILITSRDPFAKISFSIEPRGIDLEPFAPAEAVKFLKSLAPKGSDQEALQIVELLGCLPLAISQMAGVIRRKSLKYVQFLKWYQDELNAGTLHRLHSMRKEPLRPTARGDISSAFAIEHLHPRTQKLLGYCSLLDPDSIQDYLFEEASRSSDWEEFPCKDLSDWYDSREELIQSSLLKANDEKADLQIHRLLRDAMREKIPSEDLHTVFHDVLQMVKLAWPAVSHDKRHTTDRWARCEELFPHILALKNYYDVQKSRGTIKASLKLAHLLNEAGWYKHERGYSHDVKSFFDLALETCLTLDVNTQDLESDIYYASGAIANETNDRESCLRYSGLFLETRLQIAALMIGGKYNEAEKSFQQAIETYSGLPDFEIPMLSLSFANLGLCYWLQNRLNEASRTLSDALTDRETYHRVRNQKDNAFRPGRLFHALGNVAYSQGRFEESLRYHRSALLTYQATIGNNHHRTADVCHRLAQHCLRRREYDYALDLIRQALKIWHARPDTYRPEISRTTFLRAKVRFQMGQEKAATSDFKEAADLRRNISFASSKADNDLTEEDFDELLTFWSR